MFTKLISFVCVLTLASISYGAGVPMFAPPPATMLAPGDPDGGVLVADWQNSFDTLMLGWGDAMLSFSGTGATRNGTALKAVCSPGGWATALSLKLDGWKHSDYTVFDTGPKQVCPSGYANNEDFLNWLLDNCCCHTFEIDVTVNSADWVEDQDPLTNPSAGMFMVLNTGGFDNAGNPSGIWAQLATINLAMDSTTRCVWDFSQAKQDTIDMYQTFCNDRYFEVSLITMSDGYVSGTYYMDNARITCCVSPTTTTTTTARCPEYQPYEGTTTYETRTYTAVSATPWVSTNVSLITIYGKLVGVGAWQRVVTYQVTLETKTVSVCYSGWWSRFWASDGCEMQVTTTTEQLPDEHRTRCNVHWPLTGDPPPADLPPPFEEIHIPIHSIAVAEVISSSGWALEFPLFSEDVSALVALAPGFDSGSSQFATLAEAFASDPCLPPDDASRFAADCQNISAGFAQVASAMAAEALTPLEESLTFLATKLGDLQQHIDYLDMPEYRTATPHLGEAVNYLNDAVLQVGLGLDSSEEQITFLQDLQSLGVSLVDCGQSIKICVPEYGPVGDLTDDCKVNWYDVKVMSQEWLTAGSVADIYPEGSPDGIVDFGDFAVLASSWLEEKLLP